MKATRIVAIVIAIIGLSSIGMQVRAAENDQMDNPAYGAWSKFGVGSTQTLTGDMQAGQMKITMDLTRTLAEKTDDHVTIEQTATTTVAGQTHTSQPVKLTLKAKTDKVDVTDDGTENVTAADGKSYSCHVYEVKGLNAQSPDAKAKIWVSSDIPGGMVKMEASSQHGTMTQLLKSYQTK